jgi:hypothetical protein
MGGEAMLLLAQFRDVAASQRRIVHGRRHRCTDCMLMLKVKTIFSDNASRATMYFHVSFNIVSDKIRRNVI